jgi:hypothetical protein
MSELKQINIKNSNLKEDLKIKRVERFVEEGSGDGDSDSEKDAKFEKYLETSNILSEMQQHLISHIGLSMGILSTIIFISNTKSFISSYMKYIIISLMLYSVLLAITGYGEYIERFIQLYKSSKFKHATTWDFILSIIYFIVGVIMLLVIIILYISLTKEKLV